MNTYWKLFTLCVALLSFLNRPAHGQGNNEPTSFTAADLTYTCDGNYRYKFRLAVYSECGSPRGDLTTANQLNMFYSSASAGFEGGEFIVTKVAPTRGEVVKIFCEDRASNCEGGNDRGLKRFIYEGTLDLSGQERAQDWNVRWVGNLRSYYLDNTIEDASFAPYYVNATINTEDFSCNSSVQYNNGLQGPIVRACTGEEVTYNMLANDPNGDQLTYEFAQPQISEEEEMAYQSAFDELRPVSVSTPLSISDDGIVTINATTPDQIGITDVITREYRDGVLVSSIRRGIQVSTFACDNEPPVHVGYNTDSSFAARICVGQELNSGDLTLLGTDPDAGQNIRFNILQAVRRSDNQQVPVWQLGSTQLGSGSTNFFVTWNTTQSDTGVYDLEVELIDNGCPTNQITTQTYTLEVIPQPVFDLGDDVFFECSPLEITPEVEIFAEPAQYLWVSLGGEQTTDNPEGILDTLSTDPSYTVQDTGMVRLTVTDDAGCTSQDSKSFNYSLGNDFEWEKYCVGLETEFTSQAESFQTDIIRYDWFVDDNGTSVELSGEEVVYEFSQVGVYEMFHVVENGDGCIDTLMQEVEICDGDLASIIQRDSCSHDNGEIKDLRFFDGGPNFGTCGKAEYRRWRNFDENGFRISNDTFYPQEEDESAPEGVKLYIEDTGSFTIELVTQYESGCRDSLRYDYYVHPRAIYNLIQDTLLYLNCDDPDTTFQAVLDTTWQGTGTVLYEGSPAGDTISLDVSETGDYSMEVVDEMGCEYINNFQVVYPVYAGATYDPVCTPEDTMQFYAKTANSVFDIESINWDFGDMTTGQGETVQHYYQTEDDYQVTMTVTDTVGCSSDTTFTVYNTFPQNRFEMEPDTVERSICVADEVKFFTALPSASGENHIDTIYWNVGQGATSAYARDTLLPLNEGYEITHNYTGTDPVTVFNRVVYNGHPEMHDKYCEITNNSEVPIEIQPELNGTILDNRTCLGDTALFVFDRTVNPEVDLVSAQWEIVPTNDQNNPIATADTLYPKPFISRQDYVANAGYYIDAVINDVNGCVHEARAFFTVGEVPQGNIYYDELCPETPIDVSLDAPLERYDNYYFVDQESKDTLVNKKYESGNPFDVITTSYEEGGDHPVSLYMVFFEVGDFMGERKECRGVLDTIISVRPVPLLDFEADTVCAMDEAVTFVNLTDTNNTTVTGYLWDFGDDVTSTEVNPTHVFTNNGGPQEVTLQVFTEEGCEPSMTKTIYVKYKPEADFYIDNQYIEANMDLNFFDDSRSGSEINYTFYDFGDGNTSNEYDPIHSYDSVKIYDVQHVVSNVEGCSDTIVKPTDLNAYLELPNAFSPNNDGLNDELGLLHKSVYELYVFKIYNRWGELVFDANGDIDQRWDGTFRGKDQEAGVYVVHVQALGAYNTQYNFKKNITLIR